MGLWMDEQIEGQHTYMRVLMTSLQLLRPRTLNRSFERLCPRPLVELMLLSLLSLRLPALVMGFYWLCWLRWLCWFCDDEDDVDENDSHYCEK